MKVDLKETGCLSGMQDVVQLQAVKVMLIKQWVL
jgi:hypothetical protein